MLDRGFVPAGQRTTCVPQGEPPAGALHVSDRAHKRASRATIYRHANVITAPDQS
jgi:hypothetical protein